MEELMVAALVEEAPRVTKRAVWAERRRALLEAPGAVAEAMVAVAVMVATAIAWGARVALPASAGAASVVVAGWAAHPRAGRRKASACLQ